GSPLASTESCAYQSDVHRGAVKSKALLTPQEFFLSNAHPTPEMYPLSLHDALPILADSLYIFEGNAKIKHYVGMFTDYLKNAEKDRKSTRLNSSHVSISYAVFCLKKKIVQDKIGSGLAAQPQIALDL